MNKRNILTVAGIVFSFIIAIGGWAMKSRIMNIESDRLLSATMSFFVDTPAIDLLRIGEEYSNSPYTLPTLTEHEMANILRNWERPRPWSWESTGRRRLHEPAPGQIDMQQAIDAARAGLIFLYDNSILPAEMLEFNDIRAYLAQNISQGDEFLPIEFSYWNVRFFNDYMEVLMTINAVTGQVWRKEIDIMRTVHGEVSTLVPLYIGNEEIMNTLATFMTGLGLYFNDDAVYGLLPASQNIALIVETPTSPTRLPYLESNTYMHVIANFHSHLFLVSHRFADNNAIAGIATTGVLTDEGLDNFSRFTIFMTVAGIYG